MKACVHEPTVKVLDAMKVCELLGQHNILQFLEHSANMLQQTNINKISDNRSKEGWRQISAHKTVRYRFSIQTIFLQPH